MSEYYTAADHLVVLPALLLAVFGCLVLLADAFTARSAHRMKLLLALVGSGFVLAAFALMRQQQELNASTLTELTAFHGSLTIDRFAMFFNWIFLAAGAIVALVSFRMLEAEHRPMGEYFGLLLFAQCGMYFLAAGTDLITIAIGLELMALCFYVLVGFRRSEKRSNEAALKYLLLGGFSTGFLLYGFSLLYGLAGSTKLAVVTEAIAVRGAFDPIVFLAIATAAVGLLFKISAVPFHMWAPDAYEGAPTPVTAYLAVASKAASFALLTRLFLGAFHPAREMWEPILIAIAVLTLTVGNLAAITQDNVKRLLAYSSISHAGYILLGLIAGNQTGVHGIAVYLLVYTFMTLGAFLVVAAMRTQGVAGETIDEMRGLIRRSPGYAIAMLTFLVSLAGIPPLAGFLGKYYIFLALVETGHFTLAVVAALYVAVALYYYFRIVRSMFQVDESESYAELPRNWALQTALAITGVATLGIGLYPEPFLRFARIFVTGA